MKKEVDLFEAVHSYFKRSGYTIRAEVNDCDVVCIKNEELVIVELKMKFNMQVLCQVADRLRLTNKVYMAIPGDSINLFKKDTKKKLHLLRCLEVGLLTVNKVGKDYIVREVVTPKKLNKDNLQKRSKHKIESLLKEFYGRDELLNRGGSVGIKINTAYRVLCEKVALFIGYQELKLSDITKEFNNKKIPSILQKNFYGWFKRVNRGIYALSSSGLDYIENL